MKAILTTVLMVLSLAGGVASASPDAGSSAETGALGLPIGQEVRVTLIAHEGPDWSPDEMTLISASPRELEVTAADGVVADWIAPKFQATDWGIEGRHQHGYMFARMTQSVMVGEKEAAKSDMMEYRKIIGEHELISMDQETKNRLAEQAPDIGVLGTTLRLTRISDRVIRMSYEWIDTLDGNKRILTADYQLED